MTKLCVFLGIIFASFILGGCGKDATDSVVTQPCPDLGLEVKEAVLSEALDAFGYPDGETATFSTNQRQIFLTISLTDDMCCRALNVRWFDSEDNVLKWDEKIMPLLPYTNSLQAPVGGFKPGNYRVSIYIDFWEKLTLPFTIEAR